MAIDSAELRRAASGIQTTLIPGVTPNVGKDIEWRQEAGWGFPGITAEEPPIGPRIFVSPDAAPNSRVFTTPADNASSRVFTTPTGATPRIFKP